LATLRAAASFADDELVAGGGVFAHHAFVVGVAHVLGGFVLNVTARFSGFERLVDAADPLLLEGHRVDGRHFGLGLRQRQAGSCQCQGRSQGKQGTSFQGRDQHVLFSRCKCKKTTIGRQG